MFTFKKLFVATAMFCASAVMSQAALVEIYLSGSTAYRTATVTAIEALYTSGFKCAHNGSAGGEKSASLSIFEGTIGSDTVRVACHWGGSVFGIQTLAGPVAISYLDPSTLPVSGIVSGVSSPTVNHDPNVAMSDCYQTSSPFVAGATVGGVTYEALTDNIVAVVTFQWLISGNAPVGITNITQNQIRSIWNNSGVADLALLSGSPGDVGTFVLSTGRDPDSGTRVTAYAEGGIGVFTGGVNQFDISTPGSLYAEQTVNGIVFPEGSGGESSGGTLATKMLSNEANAGLIYVTYMGISDAAKATTTGTPAVPDGLKSRALTFNGVPFSATAVKNGTYSFWGYEHLFTRADLPAGAVKTYSTSLVTKIKTTPTAGDGSSIKLTDMAVIRSDDGGEVIYP